MILLHIVTKDESQALAISDYLINEKYILNPILLERVTLRRPSDAKELRSEKKTLVIAKTKALLFPVIDKYLRATYPDDMPELYSMPIVNMDWQQSEQLIETLVSI